MSGTSPRLVTWENGTDLVIELLLERDVETVWTALTDSDSVRTWFAPFRLGEDGETRTISFELDDIDLSGSVLSCEDFDHVLLELVDFGVLGIRVMPVEGRPVRRPCSSSPIPHRTLRPLGVRPPRWGRCGTRICACSPAPLASTSPRRPNQNS